MNIGAFLLIAILVGFVGIPILAVYSLREWAAIGSATFPEWQARVESQRTIYGLCRQADPLCLRVFELSIVECT